MSVDHNHLSEVTKNSDAKFNFPKDGRNLPEERSAKVARLDNTSVVRKYYNELSTNHVGSLEERNESRILYMRNFNNWIKSMLINEYVLQGQGRVHKTSLKVLDMCCGKGGDLLKWRNVAITHIICADISDMSIDQCQRRYNIMAHKNSRRASNVFSAEFITADCTKVRLREQFKDPTIELDYVSCQFAFHYCFESLQQAECMLMNASESLKPGGYFIGTVPDAYDLVSRWQKCEGNKFGNDIYSVEFDCGNKEKPPLFGAKYNFHLEGVVDCPEFLVHLPTFCKLALKFGLKLVTFVRFDDYYERTKEKGASLLDRMQALQTYPPTWSEAHIIENSKSDYDHATEYIAGHGNSKSMKIGTLSRSEWEVISLYAMFVFQKMKTTWNSEGKPEYVDL